ncbi:MULTISPECIES: hypothetical protein [unclassified Streptomyces]|uniref:hypothetical protein n=1 Tax=Streptomyces TaxID=1883 RepID=UPI000FB839A3|nr:MULTISPECIES: hypothetical protein [unclassified Streptomyces]RSS23439.1 hypothetical protein EF914_11950 [Streptomyces sp. WAC05458]
MIEPADIPLFTGDLGQLEQHIDALRDESDGVRQAGGEAHRQFQGLSAFYEAPEAEDLFASTAPARDAADSFGDKLATVADALRTYAAEVAPIAKRLQQLQSQAATFVAGLKTSTGEIDEKWAKDADKVDQHQALLHDVNAAQAAFAAAEIACNNKITALVGGTQYVLNTGDKQFVPLGAHLYGYSTDVLDQADKLPWGTPVTQHHDWWDVDDFDYYLQHSVKSFVWDGLIVDNVWGTVDGILSMSGMNGEQAFKDTWSGLARVVVGAETYLMEAGGQEPEGIWATEFAQGSKVYAKEFGKSLVAWDMWSENPARASATVVFNVLTLGVGPLKVASAGKAGTTAKVAATVAKVGDAIDPISAAAKVSGSAMPRIAAVTATLRGVDGMEGVRAPLALALPDGSRLLTENGRIVHVGADQNVIPDAQPEWGPARDRELAEVGAMARATQPDARGAGGPLPEVSDELPSSGGGNLPHQEVEHGGVTADAALGSHGPGSGGGGGDDGATGGSARWPSDGEYDPMPRGGEVEQRLRDAVKSIPGKQRPKPDVLERVISRLSVEGNGSRVADVIASGIFKESDQFGKVISDLGARKEQMYHPAADQIFFAEDLVKSGVPARSIEFEQKVPVGADMDIRVKDDSGQVYAYQMKRLNNPEDPIAEITRGKYLLQLARAEADHHIMLVDGAQGTRAEWMANGSFEALLDINRGGRGPKGEGITYIVRLEDGTLVVPPGSKTDPKDML